MEDIEEEVGLNQSRDLMNNPQYINAVQAVWSIETDKGGMSLADIWQETEFMRVQMLKTQRMMRPHIVPDLYQKVKEHAKGKTDCEERTVMCCMMMFALRLVIANMDKDSTLEDAKEKNPNHKIIKAIVRMLAQKMQKDEERMEEMKLLLQTIDKDGDENEEDGIVVPYGLDILTDAPDWTVKLKVIFSTYADKADKLIDRKVGDKFDEVWKELAEDSRFAEEMRQSSLGQDFNLLLLFNVYGMMHPDFYISSCRGAQTIAKVVGACPTFKDKDHHYSKDYFNKNLLDRLQQGFKSQSLLDHVKLIIAKHT